jgi:UDP-N-acetylglucosamine--N-acetylmuramyl-(pentapeptide) pyrophosphoryl-undecaprenol N-acetylglucosamine transferase
MTTVLIMAGGTGGHVFPALAVADVLRQRSCDVVWLGTARGIEARLVPAAGIPVEWITVSGLRGRGLRGWLLAPFALLRAIAQAVRVVRRRRPGVVLGLGGFASGPGGVAAWLLRRPLVIHEQNAIAGLTNRVLAHLATTVAEAFPGSFGSTAAVTTGNPVRATIAALPAPAERFAARGPGLRLLVFGGSQGAAVLNRILPEALAALPLEQRPAVLHQTGRERRDAVAADYAARGVVAEVREFIDDMPAAYAWADVAVCRSGALTIAELAAAGLGAILVPFAAAVDDHQTANARYLESRGAATVLREQTLTAAALAAELQRWLALGRAGLLARAEAARSAAVADAAQQVAALCLAAAEARA